MNIGDNRGATPYDGKYRVRGLEITWMDAQETIRRYNAETTTSNSDGDS